MFDLSYSWTVGRSHLPVVYDDDDDDLYAYDSTDCA